MFPFQSINGRNSVAMISREVYYFEALSIILMHNVILPVKGQPTLQSLENGNHLNSPEAEVYAEDDSRLTEQIQAMHDLLIESVQHMKDLNASFQQMNILQDTQHKTIINETQDWWKLTVGKVKLFSNFTKSY